jgi:mono/diheme cytochrome c family protein
MTTARVTVRHPPRSTQAAYGSLILAAAAAAFAWASCAQAQQAAGAVAEAAKGNEGNAANGKQLYMTIGCAYCHGTEGQGGGGRTGGLRLAQMPIPFAAFLNQLRHPANEMPPYVAAVLSDADAGDIFAYVKSLLPPADVNSISILKDLGG